MADKKITYIESSAHVMLGRTGGPTDVLAPGGRVRFEEGLESHKAIRDSIEAQDPSVAHLSLVEVDLGAEQAAAEEKADMLAQAEEIAAKVRDEEAQAAVEALEKREAGQEEAREAGAPSATEGTDFPPQDEEAIKLGEESGEGQRASTDADTEGSPKRAAKRSARS